MEFDHKQVPEDLLYKLDEAQRTEAHDMQTTDDHPIAQYPTAGLSPVGEVAAEIFAHLADVDTPQNTMLAELKKEEKNKGKGDLDDRPKPQGMVADFVADSEGATQVVEPGTSDKESVHKGRDLGGGGGGGGDGGGGGGGGSAGDDTFDLNLWRKRRRSGEDSPEDEGPEDEGPVVDESPESETSKE